MNSLVSVGPMIVMEQAGPMLGHHLAMPQQWNGLSSSQGMQQHGGGQPSLLHHPLPGSHFPNPALLLAPGHPSSAMPINASMNRSQRCGVCRGCQCKPCGACTYCQDSPQFGGPGVKKQSCIERRCLRVLENRLQRDAPTFKARVGCNSCEDCRMPDCHICLVCLDKRFFDNRYMTGAMCAKKRCNNATSIELPAAAASQEFQQRQAQKRAYDATMEFHMKRRMEMAQFMPVPMPSSIPPPPPQTMGGPLIGLPSHPSATLAMTQHIAQQQQQQQQQSSLLQPQSNPSIAPSLTPSSAATPPALDECTPTPSTPQGGMTSCDDASSSPTPLPPPSHQQQQQHHPLMIDPKLLAHNNNIMALGGPLLPSMPTVSHASTLPQLLPLPADTTNTSFLQQNVFPPGMVPADFQQFPMDYFTKAYYVDEMGLTTANGDPFVPPSYAPEMKNAVVLQPL